MRIPGLQDNDKVAKKLSLKGEQLSEGWEDIEQMLYYQGLLYVLKVIGLELIIRHCNNLLAGHYGIEKTRELIARMFYWPMLKKEVEAHIKGYNVCLALKTLEHKPYGDF